MSQRYKLIVFDKDNTLTLPKQPLDEKMAHLLDQLLAKTKVAIITGLKFETIKSHILNYLPSQNLYNLIILPTIGTQWYDFINGEWFPRYQEFLSEEEVKLIKDAFNKVLNELNLIPTKTRWEIVENRWSQVTYSWLWQNAPLEQKIKFDPDKKIRQKIVAELKKYLPDWEIGIAGSTSIDVTKKWLDKAYGISKLIKELNLQPQEILFVGDALFPWGNDEPVKKTWVNIAEVKDPQETKRVILKLLDDTN